MPPVLAVVADDATLQRLADHDIQLSPAANRLLRYAETYPDLRFPLHELGRELRYTPATVQSAVAELEHHGIAKVIQAEDAA